MASVLTCIVCVRLRSADPGRGGDGDAALAQTLAALAARNGGRAAGRDERIAAYSFAAVEPALRFALEARAGCDRVPGGLGVGVHCASLAHADAVRRGGPAELARRLAETAPRGGVIASDAIRDRGGAGTALRFVEHGRLQAPGCTALREVSRVEPVAEAPGADRIRFAAFDLDTRRFELRRDGVPVPVEPRTFDLIALLARHRGRTVPKHDIFRAVWGERIVSDAALSSQVRSARRVLGDDGARQSMIATVHGRGFRLRADACAPRAAAAPGTRGAGEAAAGGRDPRPILAVMPCANLDDDGRGTVIANGLTEDLINALSKNRWLGVITRNPAFALSRATDDIADIARALGAAYVVTGSLRRAGSRLRVTVQVTETGAMRCIWSEAFDRAMGDIFELQEEIARLVSARIATQLGLAEQRKAARTPRRNLGAWEMYQLGSAEFYRFTATSNRRCQDLMRRAIRHDPDFAEPHARLAYALILEMVYFEGTIEPARMDEALAMAERAVALADEEANAFFALGRVRLVRREYDLAIDALEQAIALNPCHALSFCGLGDSLACEGRIDEALPHFERAIALSPHDPFRWAFMSYRALAHLFADQFDPAADWARRAAHVPNAHYWARANLAAALGHLGRRSEAGAAARTLLQARPGFSRAFARERLFFVRNRDHLERFLGGLARAGID